MGIFRALEQDVAGQAGVLGEDCSSHRVAPNVELNVLRKRPAIFLVPLSVQRQFSAKSSIWRLIYHNNKLFYCRQALTGAIKTKQREPMGKLQKRVVTAPRSHEAYRAFGQQIAEATNIDGNNKSISGGGTERERGREKERERTRATHTAQT